MRFSTVLTERHRAIRLVGTSAVLAAVVLAGCTSDDDPGEAITDAAPAPTVESTTSTTQVPATTPVTSSADDEPAVTDSSTTTAPPTTGVPTTSDERVEVFIDTPDPQGSGGEFTGALVDVSATTCAADGSDWVATGVVTNPTEADATYRIYVAFLDDTGDTAGLVQAAVDVVEPAGQADYSARMPYALDGQLTCVLRVERYG